MAGPELNREEHVYQAQKFLNWLHRVRGHWEQRFSEWADGKTFHPEDRAAIWNIVDRILLQSHPSAQPRSSPARAAWGLPS